MSLYSQCSIAAGLTSPDEYSHDKQCPSNQTVLGFKASPSKTSSVEAGSFHGAEDISAKGLSVRCTEKPIFDRSLTPRGATVSIKSHPAFYNQTGLTKLDDIKAEYLYDFTVASLCAYDMVHYETKNLRKISFTPTGSDIYGLGIDKAELNKLECVAFIHKPTKWLIIAFRGTEKASDWLTNAAQLFFAKSNRYTGAMRVAEQLAKSDISVLYTGHSLGGGLAFASAMLTDRFAVTFNTAPTWKATIQKASGNKIMDYRPYERVLRVIMHKELLYQLDKETGAFDSQGIKIILPGLEDDTGSVARHSIDYMYEVLKFYVTPNKINILAILLSSEIKEQQAKEATRQATIEATVETKKQPKATKKVQCKVEYV